MKVVIANDQVFLKYLSEELDQLNVQQYHTCHCTGSDVFMFLQDRLKHKLVNINTGDRLKI